MAPFIIHQSKNGINLLDGFYLVKNETGNISVISISNGTVYVHEVTGRMSVEHLVNLDAKGQLEIFESLKNKKDLKNKT